MSRIHVHNKTALKLINKKYNAFTQFTKNTIQNDGILKDKIISIKDNISIKDDDLNTTCGSLTLRDYKSPFDATLVSLIRSNGGQIIGKTNMDEFGMGNTTTNTIFGPTINPTNEEKEKLVSGGSSGGAAASVSSGLVDVAIGTDTGGSIRLPAAYNRILGFKPSYSRISRWGVIPYAQSLDTVGIMAKVEDFKLLKDTFEVLDVYDSNDPTSMENKIRNSINLESTKTTKTKIGIPIELFEFKKFIDSKVLKEWEQLLIDLCKKLNYEIVLISIPSLKNSLSVYYTLSSSEMSSNMSRYDGIRYGYRTIEELNEPEYMINRSIGLGKEVQSRILLGTYALSSYGFNNNFIKAQKIRSNLIDEFNKVFKYKNPLIEQQQENGGVDFIIIPTSISEKAPKLENNKMISKVETYLADLLTVPSSLSGLPSLSFPYGKDKIGFQMITQFGYDKLLINEIEQVLHNI